MTSHREVRLRSDAVRWREIEQEIIAVDLGSSTYLSTNESGSFLWRRLAEGATKEALTAELQERFSIDRDRAQKDVDLFLEMLAGRGLLEDVDETS
jgi:Coenzyme PQQ synthesis protein D (PqqD)